MDAGSTTTLPDDADMIADPAAWLAGFDAGEHVGSADGRRAGHAEGYQLGFADGRAEALAEVAAREAERDDALVRSIAKQASSAIPFDALCDRRGDHDRAARQRELLTERGVTP